MEVKRNKEKLHVSSKRRKDEQGRAIQRNTARDGQ